MDKRTAAYTLEQIASFLELKGENPFRVRAFRAAARAVAAFPHDLDQGRPDACGVLLEPASAHQVDGNDVGADAGTFIGNVGRGDIESRAQVERERPLDARDRGGR